MSIKISTSRNTRSVDIHLDDEHADRFFDGVDKVIQAYSTSRGMPAKENIPMWIVSYLFCAPFKNVINDCLSLGCVMEKGNKKNVH